jgi:hypothetical protein
MKVQRCKGELHNREREGGERRYRRKEEEKTKERGEKQRKNRLCAPPQTAIRTAAAPTTPITPATLIESAPAPLLIKLNPCSAGPPGTVAATICPALVGLAVTFTSAVVVVVTEVTAEGSDEAVEEAREEERRGVRGAAPTSGVPMAKTSESA